jgi:WD40 repeat protein
MLRTTSNTASIVALTWDDGSVSICDIRTGRQLASLSEEATSAAQPVFSSDGAWLALPTSVQTADGSAVEEVAVIDPSTWTVATELVGPRSPVTRIQFSPDSSIVAGVFGATATLWSVRSSDTVAVLQGSGGRITDLTFSPDGKRVVTTSVDGTATIWDTVTGSKLLTLRGHEANVWAASYSPDGSLIATASDDGTARLWDAATGQDRGTLLGPGGRLWDAAFSADGQWVVATASSGRLFVFAASVAELVRIADARITRQLTCTERSTYLHEAVSCDSSPQPTVTSGPSG